MASAALAVLQMEQYLDKTLPDKNDHRRWENTYIQRQIEKRQNGCSFSISDHIRGMVYAMLSSGISWVRVEQYINPETRQLTKIDEIFLDYDPRHLLQTNPSDLHQKVLELKCGSVQTGKQMEALIHTNIPKLLQIEAKYGSIDAYDQDLIQKDSSMKSLVAALASDSGAYKMAQMGEALVCEYLRNVGYDLPKPDRHICRILGGSALGCSEKEEVPVYDAMDIVVQLAEELQKPCAEVDYILWSYCAKGFGNVCTKRNPRCRECPAVLCCTRGRGLCS